MAKTFGRKKDPSAGTVLENAAVVSADDKRPVQQETSSKTPEQRLAELMISPRFLVPPLLYSPLQLNIATFLGGPLAATYGLYKNAAALKEHETGFLIVCAGIAYIFALIMLLPYLGEVFQDLKYSFLPAVTAVAAHLAGDWQLKILMAKQGGGAVPEYEKQSWLIALAMGLVSFLISAVVFFLTMNFVTASPE